MDYAEVYCNDKRKARKKHRCCECYGDIVIGEIYHNHHGIFDHYPFRNKVCVVCEQLRNEYNAEQKSSDDWACSEELSEHLFESENLPLITRFLQNKEARGVVIPEYMTEKFDELTEHCEKILLTQGEI